MYETTVDQVYVLMVSRLTSAAMKANVLIPPNNPTPMQMINIIPDRVRIAESNVTSLKWDQPGVVIEKES